MKSVFLLSCMFAMAVVHPSGAFTEDTPNKNAGPLSGDEVAIYKAVLRQHGSVNNVSATTFPLDSRSEQYDLSSSSRCLQGIQLGNLDAIRHSFHMLTPNVLPEKSMRLVDPNKEDKIVRGSALFSMSEIAFDKEHTHAVVSYRFWCGRLCGDGATIVFEKVGGEWMKTKQDCGHWVS